jgi:outer membrane protein assembly factor BamA
MERIIASQKKLYDMLVFRTVNIRLESYAQQRTRARVVVEVQEDPRFGVSYGLRYNSEEKLEVFSQLDLINIFGKGRSGLIFYKQNDRQKDLRFSLKDPYIFGKKLNTLYSLSYLEETLSVFKTEEFGFTVQQELPLPFDSSVSYLFRLNRVHTYELDPIGPFPFDFTLFLPEFQIFLVRDTRLNKINAKQGSFLSLSSRYSPSFLKTDLSYISFFGQYSLYLRIRPFLIWASNYRIGLTDAFDQVLIPSRRYFAGGANSIRGFERDTVGPYDPFLKRPIGGEALFIVNQELRFPVLKWLEGVAFFDMGNVYRYINDFSPLDVRTAVGFGLRLNIPAIFLRLDYGINLSPREFEPRTVFYISIGQAF